MSEGAQWVRDEGWVPTCGFQTFPGSERYFEPPEYCDNDVVPGTEFCSDHMEDTDEHSQGSFDECYEFRTEGTPRG